MSTTHRTVVHCDARYDGQCLGFVESLRREGSPPEQGWRKGWLRGERSDGQTMDVCPACRPRFEQRVSIEPPKESAP